MAIFYKAVDVDGFDFYSHTVDYASLCGTGESLPLKPVIDEAYCCSDGVYHASTSKADTLIGGLWPCRLFEVEGDPVAEEDNKRGFFTLKVIRELPAWEALGPNGESVVRLIEQSGTLTFTQIDSLGAAGDAARAAARAAARDAAWTAAWTAARAAAGDAARAATGTAAGDAAWTAAWAAAWTAAGDAARAIVVRDLISDEHFGILTGPWVSVMGPIE